MKQIVLIVFAAALLAVTLTGCGKSSSSEKVDSKALLASFDSAAPAVKEKVGKAVSALQAEDYTTAGGLLERLLADRTITQEQRQAVQNVLKEMPPYLRSAP